MTTITTEQLFRKIDVGEYKTAIVYDRYFSNIPNNLAYFERYDCEEVEELKTKMREFVDIYGGTYSIVLKKAKGGNIATSCLCRVNLIPTQKEGSSHVQQMAPQLDAEEMKQKLLAEIKGEMQVTMLQAQVKQYEAQLGEINTTSGRMGLMLENFIMAKMGMKAPMFQQQGTLNGTVEIENEDSEVSDEDFSQALIKIKDKFGVDKLMKIAKRIEENDPMVDMIINNL